MYDMSMEKVVLVVGAAFLAILALPLVATLVEAIREEFFP